MTVTLSPHLEELVAAEISTGLFHTPEEVLLAGVEFLRERERSYLRRAVDRGLADVEAGRYTDYEPNQVPSLAEEIVQRGRQRLAVADSQR